MLTAQRLLRLTERLQGLPQKDRQYLLLDFLRKESTARRGLLFLVEPEVQCLRLLASSGPLPRRPRAGNNSRRRRHVPTLLALSGLFGSATRLNEALFISVIQREEQILPEERYWSSEAEQLLLCPLSQGAYPARGLLVLCFASRQSNQQAAQVADPSTLLVSHHFQLCLKLLASTLPSFTSAIVCEQASEKRAQKRRRGVAAVAPAATRSLSPESTIEEERARIAHSLHDGLAQELAHILHQLEAVSTLQEKQPEEAKRALNEVQQQLRQSLERLRETIATLAPAPLGDLGFELALHSLLEDFKRAEPAIILEEYLEQPLTLPRFLEATIFHVVQEALNNVRKHAQASHVRVSIRQQKERLTVSIEDNGRGFLPERRTSGLQSQLGLYFMRERVQQAGGSLTIQSAPQQGTRLEAHFSLDLASAPPTSREREILQLLSTGASNQAIARQLSLSVDAVKAHVQRLMRKLKARNRIQMVASALRQHWLE
ncbi:hybrid sensor histidine kinase/response regulator transcription factor [Thermogemmatispora sp.]|uniref:helix-turn-helix transcriptional regulator n=1 Tax=Thermogemmatispora sp. TaxID=1968838 RepID=UPI001DAE5FAD|nr:ATP-binding protein [Thermogemmatispora sp.]MBX5449388.1 ATP-binding protein [Thermogemmatispora sp.]